MEYWIIKVQSVQAKTKTIVVVDDIKLDLPYTTRYKIQKLDQILSVTYQEESIVKSFEIQLSDSIPKKNEQNWMQKMQVLKI